MATYGVLMRLRGPFGSQILVKGRHRLQLPDGNDVAWMILQIDDILNGLTCIAFLEFLGDAIFISLT